MKDFLLNACRSYEQGEALVDAGSFGGVVTLSEVANQIATKIGKPLACLLNCRFPLRVALSIAQEQVSAGNQYITVGDGGLTLMQSESGSVIYPKVTRLEDDLFSVVVHSHPISTFGLGSMLAINIDDSNTRYLTSGKVDTYEVTTEQLKKYLSLETVPVIYYGELHWSDEFDVRNC